MRITGSSEGAMPTGNMSGLKMISVAALNSSASTRSSVNGPTSTCSLSAGQPMLGSLVGSPGFAGGLREADLTELLRTAMVSRRAVRLDVTVYNPRLDEDGSAARVLVSALIAGLSGLRARPSA